MNVETNVYAVQKWLLNDLRSEVESAFYTADTMACEQHSRPTEAEIEGCKYQCLRSPDDIAAKKFVSAYRCDSV